jgi:predicted dehydrogenase
MKFKVAIVGAGHIARKAHLPYYQQHPDVELCGICSRSYQNAANTAEQFGIKNAYSSLELMLADCKPHMVSICTPNALHYDNTIMALEAGCHVLCEKPPAINATQAKAMADLAEMKGLMLAYNFQLRQSAEVKALKQFIEDDVFGHIYHVKATFTRQRGVPVRGEFLNKEMQGGGALIDIGVHILDTALHLLNYPEPKAVLANTYNYLGKQGGTGFYGPWNGKDFTIEDSCFAHISLQNNCSVTLETAFALNMPENTITNIQLYGEKAGATLFPLQLFKYENGAVVTTAIDDLPETNMHKLSIDSFIATCAGKHQNICTAREGEKMQELVGQLYSSSLT